MSEDSLKDLVKEYKFNKNHKRDLDQKHKWALGEGRVTRGQLNIRPAKLCSQSRAKAARRDLESSQHRAMKIARKHPAVFDTDTSGSDISVDEDMRDASIAPSPDVGYTYSYDAPRGPGKGSQILGLALAKAVEKFEIKVTEKLVQDEYEVVSVEQEATNTIHVADEDDFELV